MKITPTHEQVFAVLCVTQPDLTPEEIEVISSYASKEKVYMEGLGKAGFLQFQHGVASFALNKFVNSYCVPRRVKRNDIDLAVRTVGFDKDFFERLFEEEIDLSTISFKEKQQIIGMYLYMLNVGWHFEPIGEYPNIKESSDVRVPFTCSVVEPLIALNEQFEASYEEYLCVLKDEELADLMAGNITSAEYIDTHPGATVQAIYNTWRDVLATLCCAADYGLLNDQREVDLDVLLTITNSFDISYNGMSKLLGLPYLPEGSTVSHVELVNLFAFMRSANLVLTGGLPEGSLITAGNLRDPFYYGGLDALYLDN